MTFCSLCLLVCFVTFTTFDLTESFNFDVCSTTYGGNHLEVTYGNLSIKCGHSYPLEAVHSYPTIKFADADKTKLYEVLMIDPDAPSALNPTSRSWLHLWISNVPGSALSNGVSTSDSPNLGTVLVAEYKQPTPPKGTNYHRYIFVVFSHANILGPKAVHTRGGFDVEIFITENMLSKIPDAANMFEAKHP